jgi:hypothetical protein
MCQEGLLFALCFLLHVIDREKAAFQFVFREVRNGGQSPETHIAAEGNHHVVNDNGSEFKHLRECKNAVDKFLKLLICDCSRVRLIHLNLRKFYSFCFHVFICLNYYTLSVCKNTQNDYNIIT